MASFVLAISYLVYRSQKAKPTLGFDGMLGEIGDVGQNSIRQEKSSFVESCGTLKPTVRSTWVKRLKLWDIKD